MRRKRAEGGAAQARPRTRRWRAWRDGSRSGGARGDGRSTWLTSRRGLRVEVARSDGGWAIRAADGPEFAWTRCGEDELERALGLALGLDGPEAAALAARARRRLQEGSA